MVLVYRCKFEILSADEAGMLTAADWIKTNHGNKITESDADSETLTSTLTLTELEYSDAVTTIQAFKTQFTTDLQKWNMYMAQVA